MPAQDLTPQLRTRLSRVERAVGVFVSIATLLLLTGFVYYLYNTAERKGWFLTKARYFTFIDTGAGLKVGDPVRMMGFDVGAITRIDAQPPEDRFFNIYVEFEIKDPYYGYMWTEGSRARVASADLLGKRGLEVTKGTNGAPTYIFIQIRDIAPADAERLPDLASKVFLEEHHGEGTNVICAPQQVVTVDALKALIFPSPKLPTSNVPPSVPKPLGTAVTAHGEFNTPPEFRRRRNVPSVLKTSTKPFPGPASSSSLSGPSCLANVTTNRFPTAATLKGA